MRTSNILIFPVTLVDVKKGRINRKRGEKIAEILLELNLKDLRESKIQVVKSTELEEITRVFVNLLKSSVVEVLAKYAKIILIDLFNETVKIPIELLTSNPWIAEFEVSENKLSARFDVKHLKDLKINIEGKTLICKDPAIIEGLKVLYSLALYYGLICLKTSHERTSLAKAMKLYENMSDEHKTRLHHVLLQKELDWGDSFARFLSNISSVEGLSDEQITRLKEKWSAWILSQVRKDYAYDVITVREILSKHRENIYSYGCRRELYSVIKRTFDEKLEEENIIRLVKEARSRGEDVVFTRLGRASVVLGYLLASSKLIKTSNEMKEVVNEIENHIREAGLEELYITVTRLRRLVSKNEIPFAQFERVEKIFFNTLKEIRDSKERVLRDKLKKGKISLAEAERELLKLNETLVNLERLMNKLIDLIQKSPKRHGVFLFFGQRISPRGAARIAYINENLMPYAGPTYGLEEYIIEGSCNVHATPSLAALKYVDYWIEALPLFIMETGEGTYEIDYENMEAAIRKMAPFWALNIERAVKEGTKRPTFIVVTTQSYNMTNLVRFWLEEEMALFNLVRAHGLEDEVRKTVNEYTERIVKYAEEIIREQHLEQALEIELQRSRDKKRAIFSMIVKDSSFAREVANLAVIIEHGLREEVEREVKAVLIENPKIEANEARKIARERVLKRHVVDAKTFKIVPQEKATKGSVSLYELAKRYLRDHIDLAESTARKEVVTKHGLLTELTKFKYEAVGPRKMYNLVYAPSRVDLGPHEIESVIDLGQPLGAFDEEAAKASVELFEKINRSVEGPYVLPNPASAEGQKTLENASRDDNYAFANLVALTAEAMGANAYSIISYINVRPTHLILWPGRGYGGFCIPKDGLFVSYVLGLKDRDVLDKLGIPRHLQERVVEIVNEVLESKLEYEDPLEWQEVAYERLKEYLELFQEVGVYVDDLVHISEIIEKLCGKRTKWNEYLRKVARTLYEARYVPSRMVNNFMPYHTAALIYHALERARERSPLVCPDSEARIGIQASYKPGVQDSRLSTEFELFLALTKSDLRLNRMRWKVLKKLAHMILDEHDTPKEIRVIDPLISAEDWLFDSEIRLRVRAEAIKEFLLERIEGFSEDDIKANVIKYGANFEEWTIGFDEEGREVKVKNKPEILLDFARDCLIEIGFDEEKVKRNIREYGTDFSKWPEFKNNPKLLKLLKNKIKGKMHWLVVYTKGIERNFEEGVKGLDVLSLGIPHPDLVKLVHDPVRLAFLMKEGNPNSALAIVDGAAGARGVVFDKDMAKEWLALGGTYVAIGVSDEIIDSWYKEMVEESELAGELLTHIMDGNYVKAQALVNRISKRLSRKFEEYYWLAEGKELGLDSREYGAYKEKYRILLKLLERIQEGLHIADLDFGTFLALGGRFYILRRAAEFGSYEEFRRYVLNLRRRFEERIRKAPILIPGAPPRKGMLSSEEVDEAVKLLLLREKPKLEEVEIVLGGALKGEMKEEWEVMQRRLIRLRQRRALLVEKYLEQIREKDFESMFKEAKATIGEPRANITDEDYCKFLIYTTKALASLTLELTKSYDEKERVWEYMLDNILKRGGISVQVHKVLIDHLAYLATYAKGDKNILEKIAKAAELIDISLAIELISTAQTWKEVWTAVARFFDRTLNCHIFDYAPYLYTRAAFSKDENFNDVFTRRELFELITRRHMWLYEYIKKAITERTELKLWDRETVEKLLTIGTDGDDIAVKEGYTEASKFVFSYARLRDLATLYHDGFFIPEVLDNVDPEAIKGDERVNVVIMYNLGNTTAMTFLRRGPYHHEGKGPDKNIIMTNFLKLSKDPKSGREVALVEYGLMYLTKEEYRKAGGRNDILKLIVDPELKKKYAEIGPEGRLVFVRFKRPILACVVFPHFTHPWFLNQVLEKIGVPLNQTRVIDRLTYKKTEMPEMIKYYNERVPPEERVDFIDQVNIYKDEMKRLTPEERRKRVEEILLEFSKKHSKIIIKTSTESGGRGTIIARIRDEKGNITNENIRGIDGSVEVYGFKDAVDFILREILPKDDAVVQEFIESKPREILTEEALREVIKRFESVGIRVRENTPLYWSFRNYVTQVPGSEPQIVGWIMLIHVKGIANYGQGGQLFLLEREMFKPKYQYLIDEMERVSKATMKMLEMYAPVFAEKEGIEVGKDLLGNPYYIPMTNLSDMMFKPIYRNDKIVEWRVVPIEENIGMGLFYPYERELAKRGREGESVDPILINLAIVGKAYKELLEKLSSN